MLLAVTGSLAAIAAEVGCKNPQSVHEWKAGRKKPDPVTRARIYAAFGIPVKAWSVAPGGALVDDDVPPKDADDPIVEGVPNPSTLDEVKRLQSIVQRDSAASLVPSERAKFVVVELRMLELKEKIEDKAEMSEARYVAQHPAWLRARKLIIAALEPHPIAAQAVLDALQKAGI